MQLTEHIQLQPTPALSHLCHLAKNLYNEANFEFRQFFFNLGECVNYYDLQVMLKHAECYKVLPAQTSQQVLALVIKNWKAYFAALKEYRIHPEKFLGHPTRPITRRRTGNRLPPSPTRTRGLKAGTFTFPRKRICRPSRLASRSTSKFASFPKGLATHVKLSTMFRKWI